MTTMSRGNILDRVCGITGDTNTSSPLRTYVTTSVNQMLFALWDRHDWEFKHKTGSFNTVGGTESYDVSVSSADLRSATDLEVVYDKTNKRFLGPTDLRNIRKAYPGEDLSQNQPLVFSPWGVHTIFLTPIPLDIYQIKYLYTSVPTLPTTDNDDLWTVCGLPNYMHYVFEKMLLAEAFLFTDDSRRNELLTEIEQLWMKKAIEADMKHLESNARFKFWEEEVRPMGHTYDDFLRQAWWGEN